MLPFPGEPPGGPPAPAPACAPCKPFTRGRPRPVSPAQRGLQVWLSWPSFLSPLTLPFPLNKLLFSNLLLTFISNFPESCKFLYPRHHQAPPPLTFRSICSPTRPSPTPPPLSLAFFPQSGSQWPLVLRCVCPQSGALLCNYVPQSRGSVLHASPQTVSCPAASSPVLTQNPIQEHTLHFVVTSWISSSLDGFRSLALSCVPRTPIVWPSAWSF